jgi:hypothetical protein
VYKRYRIIFSLFYTFLHFIYLFLLKENRSVKILLSFLKQKSLTKMVFILLYFFYTPAPRRGRGVYCFTSVRPSKIFFVAFLSVTVDGRNLIFGHKLHIGMPYCGKRFWTRQIPTFCFRLC